MPMSMDDHKRLSISSVIGVSSQDSATFAVVDDLVAYVAGAGVVVAHVVNDELKERRFFCAKSGKSTDTSSANSYLNMIPGLNSAGSDKAKRALDSYGYPVGEDSMEIIDGNNGGNDQVLLSTNNEVSPSKLADKIRNISCIAMSLNKKLLAVGESGYQPRILIYSLASDSSNHPIYQIQDHKFGIHRLAFLPNSRCLASLGFINDGFLNVWDIQEKTKLLTNKCTSVVNSLIWEDEFRILTLGVRHIKMWNVPMVDVTSKVHTLNGRNVHLNDSLNSNFISACSVNANTMLILSDKGDLGVLNMEGPDLVLEIVNQIDPNVSEILVDDGRLWMANDDLQMHDLDHVMRGDNLNNISKKRLSKFSMSIRKFHDKLIYLTKEKEIKIYDNGDIKLLVDAIVNDIGGVRKCFNGDNIIWSKNGILQKLTTAGAERVLTVQLQENALITNLLTAVECNHEGEIFVGDKFGVLMVYQDGIQKQNFKAHESTITGIVYCEWQDWKFVISISRDRMIQIFVKDDDWSLLQTLSLHKGTLNDVLYHDGKIIVSSSDRTVSCHRFSSADESTDLSDKLSKLNLEDQIQINREKIISLKSAPVSMSILGNELIISTQDKTLTFCKLNKFDKSRSLKLYNEFNESVLCERFIISGGLIYVSSNDKSLRCFQYLNGKQLKLNWGHSELIIGLIELDVGKLGSVGNDGCLFVWDYETEPAIVSPSLNTPLNTPLKSTPIIDTIPVTRKIKTPLQKPVRTRSPVTVTPSGSPTRLRQSTLDRLSQPMRSPTKLSTPAEVGKMCEQLQKNIILNSINKPDLQAIKLDIGRIWKLLNDESESKLLESYSEKLLQIVEQKLNK